MPEELWMEVCDIIQETVIKTISKKKKCKKAKWLSEEALQIAMKRSKKQRRKGKIYPFECRVPKNSEERDAQRLEGSAVVGKEWPGPNPSSPRPGHGTHVCA